MRQPRRGGRRPPLHLDGAASSPAAPLPVPDRRREVLTLTGLLLVWVSLMAVFVRYELLDNNTFRDTSQQLVQSKAIQAQLTARAVQVLYQNVDVDAQIRSSCPSGRASRRTSRMP